MLWKRSFDRFDSTTSAFSLQFKKVTGKDIKFQNCSSMRI